MRVVGKQILNLLGPLSLAALSLFVSFIILQPIAIFFHPTFHLLSSRGVGKITFTTMVILQLLLLLTYLPKKFLNKLLRINVFFFTEKNCLKLFFRYFAIFFFLHVAILFLTYLFGFAQYNPNWGSFTISLIARTMFGFVVTFFLAWTEELIFRGVIFPYFCRYLTCFSSLITTSTIFMFAHNLSNPIDLITTNWRLGLGLFLLGMLLNLVFIDTEKLYTGMGLHAGIVFVKVILRRAPFLIFLPANFLPFWVCKDLRMAPLTHLLFFITILIFIYKNKTRLFSS